MMEGPACVSSIAAIQDFKNALVMYVAESRQGVTTMDVEIRRAFDWIAVDRAQFWRNEIRRATDAVARAKDELHNARTFKRMDDHVPSCIEERKALERAQRRLAVAEQKAEAVKKWTRALRHEINEYIGRMAQFSAVLEIDLPKAMAALERTLSALDDYISTKAPKPMADPHSADAVSVGSMALPLVEREKNDGTETEQSDAPPAAETAASRSNERANVESTANSSAAVHEEAPS